MNGLNVHIIENSTVTNRFRGQKTRCQNMVTSLIRELLTEAGYTEGSFALQFVRGKSSKSKKGISNIQRKGNEIHVTLYDGADDSENGIYAFRPPNTADITQFHAKLTESLKSIHQPRRRESENHTIVEDCAQEGPSPSLQTATPTTSEERTSADPTADELELHIMELEEVLAKALEEIATGEKKRLALEKLLRSHSEKRNPVEKEQLALEEKKSRLEREIAERQQELEDTKRLAKQNRQKLEPLSRERNKVAADLETLGNLLGEHHNTVASTKQEVNRAKGLLAKHQQEQLKPRTAKNAIDKLRAAGIDESTLRRALGE